MTKKAQTTLSVSAISSALQSNPVLPGEDGELYKKGLMGLIAELEAKTVLQVYLAEKIFDCLWWIRRYEEQKRITIIAEMAHLVHNDGIMGISAKEAKIREALLDNTIDQYTLREISAIGHTVPSLRQAAMGKKHLYIQQLDQNIALQSKILAGLQSSFEVAFNRKLNTERLMLQNELLRKNLDSIDVTPTLSSHGTQ